MSKKPLVQYHFLTISTLRNRGHLKRYILSIFKKEKRTLKELNIIFCDDNYLLELNRKFLKHDFYTDILSFPLSDAKHPLVAEIYISTDRVRENAHSSGSSFKEELHRIIFHGILHLCGFRDKSVADIKKIRAREDKHLKIYFQKIKGSA